MSHFPSRYMSKLTNYTAPSPHFYFFFSLLPSFLKIYVKDRARGRQFYPQVHSPNDMAESGQSQQGSSSLPHK